MAKTMETTILAQVEDKRVVRIVRTYSTSKRAQEDLNLLCESFPEATFELLTVEHIDD